MSEPLNQPDRWPGDRADGTPGELPARKASAFIDQDEWQPALLPSGQVRVMYFDGPLAGRWGFSHGAPSFLLCDWDGVTFLEYERYDEKYDASGNVDHVEYVYRRTVGEP